MLKRVLSNILVIAALLAPVAVCAKNDNTTTDNHQVIAQLSVPANVAKAADVKEAPLAAVEQYEAVNAQNNEADTLLTDMWLIFLALLGFVMLSNRSGV